jgi:hypothetical protein
VVGELETGAFCLNRKTQHLFKLLSLCVAHNTEIFLCNALIYVPFVSLRYLMWMAYTQDGQFGVFLHSKNR